MLEKVVETGLAFRANPGIVGQNGHRVRVVVCSQVAASLRDMAQLLKEAGFDVVTCQGFSELMDMAEDIHPRLIIIEENEWPWGRGVDLLALRKMSRASVIAVGISSEMETMARALNAGADFYLVKPFGRAEL
ncbi:MAG: response regulator, partial [Dehalococcoidia bacterium]|nr:response regulator [Dehalococcoidia bacterium]